MTDDWINDGRDRTLVLVAGCCRRGDCCRPFTETVERWQVAGMLATSSWPAYCSRPCKRREAVRRVKARRREDQEVVAPVAAVASAAPKVGQLCPACWLRPRCGAVCQVCFRIARRSCAGKARWRTKGDADRVCGQQAGRAARELVSYPCGVCQWWHLARNVSGRRVKQVQFTVRTLVGRIDVDVLGRLRLEWAGAPVPVAKDPLTYTIGDVFAEALQAAGG